MLSMLIHVSCLHCVVLAGRHLRVVGKSRSQTRTEQQVCIPFGALVVSEFYLPISS
jgi:hypothetical protein